MAKRESVLTENMKNSMEIEKFIFHIILKNGLKPLYLSEVILEVDQIEFFKKRLSDVAQGRRYVFTDIENSTTHSLYKDIINDKDKFLKLSKKLVASFQERHNNNMSDGVFVVSVVKMDGDASYLFLLKIDNRLVYRYNIDSDKKAVLKKIKQTFVEDPKAVQKMALICLSDKFVWDVLAFDRSKNSEQSGIGNYFRNFLGVTEKDDIYELTTKAMRSAGRWIKENPEFMAEGETRSHYRQRSINHLSSHNILNTDELINSVVYYKRADDITEKDEAVLNAKQEAAKQSYKNFLQAIGLYGQSFNISEKALKGDKIKHINCTAEGLTIAWTGSPESVNLEILKSNSEENESDLNIIRIKTKNIIEISE